jgi:diacylglycerol kinase family enzyme
VTRPALRRVQAVINPASGGVGPDAAAVLGELVSRHGFDLSIRTPETADIGAAVDAAVNADPDLVVILAGDGTARLAAARCGPSGPLVAPLAGGTLNMLPHAIYGRRPWKAALSETLETGVERKVSGGRVDGHPFYVAAIVGAPALWADVREAARAGQLRHAWRRADYALRRAFTGSLHYVLDGAAKDARAEALVLITPLVSRTMREEAGLEAAAFGVRNIQEAMRLALNGLIADWRADPGVTVEVCRRGRLAARRSIPAVLDGEVRRLPHMAEFEFQPKAFRVLAPARSTETP